jgi:glycine/D-amino acid oxidase-like deaminating enzyme
MSSERRAVRRHRDAEALDALADVLVIGGGPAGAWAAVAAAEAGSRVIPVDKGYLGTSGATAPSNTGTWFVPPGEGRRAAIEQRQPRTGFLPIRWVVRTLDTAWENSTAPAARGYPFPIRRGGRPYWPTAWSGLHALRRRVLTAGVTILVTIRR